MELTILLAKIFGIYMILAGVAVLTNRKHLLVGIIAMPKERFAQLVAGLITLLAGLVLVNVHNVWTTLAASIISLIGWIAVAKGLVYLLMPEAKLVKLLHALTNRSWYIVDGVVAILAGLYLAGFGYGWF